MQFRFPLLLLFACGSLAAPAANYAWNGAVSQSWSHPHNWHSSNGVPSLVEDTAIISSGMVNLESADLTIGTLKLTNSTLTGGGVLTVSNELHWSGGTMSGTGVTTLLPGGSGTLSGAVKVLDGGRVFHNHGTLVWTGGAFSLHQGTWNNHGLLDCQSDDQWSDGSNSHVGSFFHNPGVVRKSGGTGTTTFGLLELFENTGLLDIRTGTVSLIGDYLPAAFSNHRFVIGGTSPGTDFGRLTITGTASLAGGLELALAGEFKPANADVFQILNAGVRTGGFGSVTGPGLGNGRSFGTEYQVAGVLLVVKVGQPTFDTTQAEFDNSQFQVPIKGENGVVYVVEASTNLLDWMPVATNTLTSTIWNYVDPDAPAYPYRFYRAVVQP